MENQDIFKSVPYIYNASSFEYKLTNVFKKNTDCQLEANIIVKCIYNHRTTKTNQKYPSVNL